MFLASLAAGVFARGGDVFSVGFWIGMLSTARWLEMLQRAKKKGGGGGGGGRKYTVSQIMTKNMGRNTTFSSFLLKYKGRNYNFSRDLKRGGQNAEHM